jgi:hypothetical protein
MARNRVSLGKLKPNSAAHRSVAAMAAKRPPPRFQCRFWSFRGVSGRSAEQTGGTVNGCGNEPTRRQRRLASPSTVRPGSGIPLVLSPQQSPSDNLHPLRRPPSKRRATLPMEYTPESTKVKLAVARSARTALVWFHASRQRASICHKFRARLSAPPFLQSRASPVTCHTSVTCQCRGLNQPILQRGPSSSPWSR